VWLVTRAHGVVRAAQLAERRGLTMVIRGFGAMVAVLFCAACGGQATVTGPSDAVLNPPSVGATAGAGSDPWQSTGVAAATPDPASNAPTLVVEMSMEIPKPPRPGVTGAAGAAPGTPGAPAAPGTPAAPAAPPPVMGTLGDPMIPEIKGECPNLESGPIAYMGLSGQVQSGVMPASPTAPMLLYWHGTGSSAGEYAGMAAAIAQGVTSQGGVIVSFQNTTNQGDCSPSGTFIFCTGDFDVMDQYVACAVKNRNVDPRRIYTAGCSAGGLMATAMAAQRSQYIAAAAPNSGGLAIPTQFSTMNTPALMTVHGAAGADVVVIDFSQSSATADMLFKGRGGFVVNCDTGGAHCGGGGLAGAAWDFMQAHPYGIMPLPWSGGLPPGFPAQCKIF
jgi:predicted esterase